jgi:hypothetical protein
MGETRGGGSNMSNKFTRFVQRNAKNIVVGGAFLFAMAGAAGLGLATKQFGSAAGVRDSGTNPIMNKGSIGCLSLSECVSDIKANNPSDLKAIYDKNGLSPSEYTRFAQTAKAGKVYKDGRIVVDGQTVLTDAWSMGRNKFGKSTRIGFQINGKTYYKSTTQNSFNSNSIDAFVMFDDKGAVEFALLTACGNPVWGTKKTPEYGCKALNKTAVSGKQNTYDFTTTLNPTKLATLDKLVYNYGDGSKEVTTKSASQKVTHQFNKAGNYTITVTVYYKLPGGKVVSVKCLTKVTVVMPYYTCDAVIARALNDEKTKFRFTVKTSQGNGATLKDADFTLDGSSTVTGVTVKDEEGNIYREYDFARDGKDHTVVVKVNFNLADGVQSKTCEAKVTAGETPMCPVPGKEHLPADSDECVENCPIPGKEHLPKDSDQCEEEETPPPVTPPVTELPKTGMGGVLGVFAGTTAAGAVAHRVFMRRRDS